LFILVSLTSDLYLFFDIDHFGRRFSIFWCPQSELGTESKMSGLGVRRGKVAGASPTRQSLQPEAPGEVMEVTIWLKHSV
jgi:hypothetical protein